MGVAGCDFINDFLESLDRLSLVLLYYFKKEDRIINVNATTIIIRGKKAKALSLKIKGICESIISFHCGFLQYGKTPPLISHVYEWLIEGDRLVSRHHTHYKGQNRPDSVKSFTIRDFFFSNLQMLEASDYCLTCVWNLKISELEGVAEVVGLAQSV